jgi:hypothetical protein
MQSHQLNGRPSASAVIRADRLSGSFIGNFLGAVFPRETLFTGNQFIQRGEAVWFTNVLALLRQNGLCYW